MRCDANVSLKPAGTTEFGTRTETKNVNSLKSVEVAVRYEMQRQGAILASGGRITQETRHFHEAGYTSAGRTKETAEDYRYFPEPDLEPVAPSRELVERLRQTIPELPWLSRRRIQQEWGVSDEVMRDLVNAGAVELVAATVEHGASSEARAPGGETSWRKRPTRPASGWTNWPSLLPRSQPWWHWSMRASCPTAWPAKSWRVCWPVKVSPNR